MLSLVFTRHETIQSECTVNPLLSFIANKIYKHKMYCRFDNTEETNQFLFYAVKDSVFTYSNVLGCMQKTNDENFFFFFFELYLKL